MIQRMVSPRLNRSSNISDKPSRRRNAAHEQDRSDPAMNSRQSERKAARIMALTMGGLFITILALNAITF